MARTQQKRRQMRKGSKRMTDDERKANILAVCNKLGLSPDEDEGPYEDYTTEEADTTKQAAASTTKDAIVTCLEFASQIGFDRKVSCLTYFYLTRFPRAKSEFQTRFETRSRYSHTPPETTVIVNREKINIFLRSIYAGSNWNPNTITNP